MSLNLRFKVVKESFNKRPVDVIVPNERPSEYFARRVFNREKMFHYLPKDTFERYTEVLEKHLPLDRAIADSIAEGMKRWAFEMGATHCTHWFQPLNEGTAEKHDDFLEHDGKGGMLENFSGKQLIQQEPDASSFPSGGIRSTFEARGYTAWDPSSPVFILGDTLMIPTIFISYTGEALDYKAPLKKSIAAVGKAATEVARYFYPKVESVQTNLGWEQEYFLIDEDLYAARPDLVLTGRTLMGRVAAKNQQMDDHYFGAIPERVVAFMQDLEIQALELGIPCKTRHNEVAPNQFELAPIYEECNLAVDHNMLLMLLMRRVAVKHGFQCLLHEKPFAGVNGSGKHENWSLVTNEGVLLHSPGKTSMDNLRFAVFVVETMMAVYRHNGLMKASIVDAGNAHRLGAHEAPPAIISAFTGRQLDKLLDHIEHADIDDLFEVKRKYGVKLDIPQIPELFIDSTDRNRTSPFAFTGNRFEFRAIGSSANCAGALIALNSAVAESLVSFKDRVDALIQKGENKVGAIIDVLKSDIATCKPLRFSGNGYAEEWLQEASKRGLDCENNCPLIYDNYISPESIKMFEATNVMNRHELEARNEIKWEIYQKKIQIEARVLEELCHSSIIPAVIKYQSLLLDNVATTQKVYSNNPEMLERLTLENKKRIEDIGERLHQITKLTDELIENRKMANRIENVREKAVVYHDKVMILIEKIRYHVDKLELVVDNNIWPLPKYRELFFLG